MHLCSRHSEKGSVWCTCDREAKCAAITVLTENKRILWQVNSTTPENTVNVHDSSESRPCKVRKTVMEIMELEESVCPDNNYSSSAHSIWSHVICPFTGRLKISHGHIGGWNRCDAERSELLSRITSGLSAWFWKASATHNSIQSCVSEPYSVQTKIQK